MPKLQDIELQSMPETAPWRTVQVARMLGNLLRHEIPAFVLRGHDSPELMHAAHGQIVAYAMREVQPSLPVGLARVDFHEPKRGASGLFHTDILRGGRGSLAVPHTNPDITTVTQGGCFVFVAHLGNKPQEAYRYADFYNQPPTDVNHPHNTLLRHHVDPEIVDPLIFYGHLAAGDSVISAGSFGSHATWHRFDAYDESNDFTLARSELTRTDDLAAGFDFCQ